MNVSCQFSIYPLGVAGLSPDLEAALDAMRRRGLEPALGTMSSVVSGPLHQVMAGLGDAFAAAASGNCVMVMTLSNACPVPQAEAT
jgi:uncharacterized protein YqgV (UPF0045/DUF77 family)